LSTNGHDPAVTHLGEIIDATRPRVVKLPSAIDRGSVTMYELSMVGRALGLTPQGIDAAVREQGWDAIELQQALVWVILKRREPDLTWEEARTFALDLETPPDPQTPALAGSSTLGTDSSSTSVGPLASRRRKSET
jgi:hypothetical protein